MVVYFKDLKRPPVEDKIIKSNDFKDFFLHVTTKHNKFDNLMKRN